MTPDKPRLPFYLAIAWAAALSILTAMALPQQYLTADILLQSVMSLQNVTLYFWGQNRLVNLLPLGVSWIRDPAANLTAVLVLSSMFFHLLLLALSRFAAAAVDAADLEALSLKAFVFVSTAFVVSFTPRAVFEIEIAHFEYSLPALLLAVAVQFSILRARWSAGSLAATAAAAVLAIGVNPATVIPGVFLAGAAALYRKRAGVAEAFLAASCLLAFLAWSLVAARHGDSHYASFDPALLPTGIGRVLKGLAGAFQPIPSLLVVGALVLARALAIPRDGEGSALADRPATFTRNGAIVFAAGWLLLFAGNHWVEENRFSSRYFIYIFFVVLLCTALSSAKLLASIGRRASAATTIGAAALALVLSASPFAAFEDYKVFREASAYAQPGRHLYAGDYWLVWPSVLRDMMQGHASYGMTTRGEANRAAVRDHVLRGIRREGAVAVLCLNAAPEECGRQIQSVAGPVPISGPVRLRDKVYEFRLGEPAARLDYQGASFLGLPSLVGVADGGMRRSNGSAGFMLFGPYVPLRAGRYRLDVYGAADVPAGAYADVVSASGTRVFARFPLQAGAGGAPVRNAAVSIPADTDRVEVRVWVSGQSRVALTGYRLSDD